AVFHTVFCARAVFSHSAWAASTSGSGPAIFFSRAATAAVSSSRRRCWRGGGTRGRGAALPLVPARAVPGTFGKEADTREYTCWVNGSNLWSWHWAHPSVWPIHTVAVVLTRSTM